MPAKAIWTVFLLGLLSLLALPAGAEEPDLVPLPAQPENVPWPTDSWPQRTPDPAMQALLTDIIAGEAPGRPDGARALLVIQGGEIVGEAYADGYGPEMQFPSWSMAKSVTHALVGVLIADGQIDIYAPADVPRWHRKVNDHRAAITLEQLLRMESGLLFSEDYGNPDESHVLQMLFGRGRLDMAEYAAGQLQEAAPGTHWQYASGTTNIISGVVRDTIGAETAADYRRFMEESLLRRIGIDGAIPEFDAAGTFIGSSYIHMTARDWGRFGLLYLRDGLWEGRRILPARWADHARLPTPNSKGQYGAHFWLNGINPDTGEAVISDKVPTDAFMARGFGAQVTLIIPSLDMILVYLGVSYEEDPTPVITAIEDIVALVRN